MQDGVLHLNAQRVGEYAAEAGVGHLVPTHRWPGVAPEDLREAAAEAYRGPIDVARPELVVEI